MNSKKNGWRRRKLIVSPFFSILFISIRWSCFFLNSYNLWCSCASLSPSLFADCFFVAVFVCRLFGVAQSINIFMCALDGCKKAKTMSAIYAKSKVKSAENDVSKRCVICFIWCGSLICARHIYLYHFCFLNKLPFFPFVRRISSNSSHICLFALGTKWFLRHESRVNYVYTCRIM